MKKSELEWQLLHSALTMAETVSQIGLIMFGLKDVWGFKSSFVWISGQTLADI